MPDNVKDNPVEKREALLADRLRLHKGYRHTGMKIFSKGDFTLVRLVADSEEGIMDDVFRLEYGDCEFKI